MGNPQMPVPNFSQGNPLRGGKPPLKSVGQTTGRQQFQDTQRQRDNWGEYYSDANTQNTFYDTAYYDSQAQQSAGYYDSQQQSNAHYESEQTGYYESQQDGQYRDNNGNWGEYYSEGDYQPDGGYGNNNYYYE